MMGFVRMRDAGVMLRLPEGVQGLRMKLNDILKRLKWQIMQRALTHCHYSQAIGQPHTVIYLVPSKWKSNDWALLFLIVVVAAFNIVSSLVMLVTDKNQTSPF